MFNMDLTCDIPVLENDYKGALKGGVHGSAQLSMNQNTFSPLLAMAQACLI